MTLLTATTATGQATKVNPGDTITVTEPSVLLPGSEFIDIVNQLDSLQFYKAKLGASEDLRVFWEREYQTLRELMRERPKQSLLDKIEEAALPITLGYAACQISE